MDKFANGSHFVTIPNGYSPDEFEALGDGGPDPARSLPGQFAMTYTGSLYMWRDPTGVMVALRRLFDEGTITPGEVVLNLVGRCQVARGRSVQAIASELGLDTVVRVPGPVSRREALRYLVHSDLLLLLAEGLTLQVPGKAYEYLRARRPVLALAPEGATADLIRETRAGVVVAPDDVPAIAAAIERFVRLWRAGRPHRGADPELVRRFDRRALTARFAALFSQVASWRLS
jgi:glycosyltransferase involved in cell wall biosynthesis